MLPMVLVKTGHVAMVMGLLHLSYSIHTDITKIHILEGIAFQVPRGTNIWNLEAWRVTYSYIKGVFPRDLDVVSIIIIVHS